MKFALEMAWALPHSIREPVISKFLLPRLAGRSLAVKTRDGFTLWCDPSDFIQNTVLRSGVWDHEVADAIRKHLKPGQLFCDIGANIGYFSMLAAHLGARVVAFEPQPSCAEAFRRNASINGFKNTILHQLALSIEEGEAILYLEGDQNTGAASLHTRSGETIAVKTRRLDDVLTEKPHLIKMDIEGAEVRALEGASRILTGPDRPPVICEVSEFSLRQLGNSKDQLFDLMGGHGYRAEIISRIRRSNAVTHAVYFQYDVLFQPID
ncbi:MAG TPA: FkbM family methyltransferase [Rhizomicrobium sp.]|nr:FkbM family methyltransferase [Rhizomicrobium sp.]